MLVLSGIATIYAVKTIGLALGIGIGMFLVLLLIYIRQSKLDDRC
jgi:hypothetical protein